MDGNLAMKGVINTNQEIIIKISMPVGAAVSLPVPADLVHLEVEGIEEKPLIHNQELAVKEPDSWERFPVPEELEKLRPSGPAP